MTPVTIERQASTWASDHNLVFHASCEEEAPFYFNENYPNPWSGGPSLGIILVFMAYKTSTLAVWLNSNGKRNMAAWRNSGFSKFSVIRIPEFKDEHEIPEILNKVRSDYLRDQFYRPYVFEWLRERNAAIRNEFESSPPPAIHAREAWSEVSQGHGLHELTNLEFSGSFLNDERAVLAFSGLGQAAIYRLKRDGPYLDSLGSGFENPHELTEWLDLQFSRYPSD